MNSTTIIIVFIGVSSGIVSTIAAKDIILDKSKRGWRKITRHGTVFIVCTVSLVILPLIQFNCQNIIDEKKDRARQEDEREIYSSLRVRYDASIKEMKDKFDTSNNRTVALVAEMLGKYGFRLDTTNKRLARLEIGDAPVLIADNIDDPKGISYLGFSNGLYHYEANFASRDASCCCFDIEINFVIKDSLRGFQLEVGPSFKFLDSNTKIPKGFAVTRFFDIPGRAKFNYLYMWIRGTYKSFDGSVSYPINQVVYNNKNGNVCGTMLGKTREMVINTVKSH